MDNFFKTCDILTILILALVLLPILINLFKEVSQYSVWISLVSMLRFIEISVSIFISFFLIKILFFEKQIPFFQTIKEAIVGNANNTIDQNTIIYTYALPVFFLLIYLLLRLITRSSETKLFVVLSEKLHMLFELLWSPIKVLLRLVVVLPKAALNLFIICLILAVFDLYLPTSTISDQIEQSRLYNSVHQFAIEPILKSSYVQKLPVLFNRTITQYDNSSLSDMISENGKLPDRLENGVKVIWYFNGVTIDEAIKSNENINCFARQLVGSETDTRKKARKIYRWIGTHIKYDFNKAEKLNNTERDMPSGAINTFNTRKGICFDYSSLYVAMCRAVGIKVRLITGIGFDGTSWGDHAWNQVFIPEENSWLNVDTTFAMGGNYFDRPGFKNDHKTARIAGEW